MRTVTTRPPARYTEGALIKVMKEAWRLVEDPRYRARLKEAKGIGTPATRSSIVQGLLDQKQLVKRGKHLVPSDGGMKLYDMLSKVCPAVVDPARTAAWETLFDGVERGKISAEEAVLRILEGVKTELGRIGQASGGISISIGATSRPTPKMVAAAKSVAERKGVKLPRGATTDSNVCRAFLDAHLGAGEGEPRRPSEKQLAFAERLAAERGTKVPVEALKSSRELSRWIDTHKSQS